MAHIEFVCRGIPEGRANDLWSKMHGLLASAKPPKFNISKEGQEAFRSLQKAINNKYVLVRVLALDKGRAIVLEDPETYEKNSKLQKVHTQRPISQLQDPPSSTPKARSGQKPF